ncbi:unnamed protein product [Pleuronectes platessa]|uniref:Uncharacterized protein n=1 Tax=Pleuronectes platessa TaxID=8262 RepID=A0A9N7ZB67_PLEPL|nr:unnamed protein product [Pleuronectes platessa]
MQSDGMRETSAKVPGVLSAPRSFFVSSRRIRESEEGCRGLFSIKDLSRLNPLSCPPRQIPTDFKARNNPGGSEACQPTEKRSPHRGQGGSGGPVFGDCRSKRAQELYSTETKNKGTQ